MNNAENKKEKEQVNDEENKKELEPWPTAQNKQAHTNKTNEINQPPNQKKTSELEALFKLDKTIQQTNKKIKKQTQVKMNKWKKWNYRLNQQTKKMKCIEMKKKWTQN